MSSNVLTQRNDVGRSGISINPAASPGANLIPANVNVNSFGRLFKVQLNGDVYAQPLYVSQLDFGGVNHDTVFVATMNNFVYAIDANTGNILAQQQVGAKPPVPRELIDNGGYRDVVGDRPNVGILSTPVIDLGTQEMYVVLFTVDATAARAAAPDQKAESFQHILCALDLTTLTVKRSQPIAGSVSGEGVSRTERGLQQRPVITNGQVTLQTVFDRSPVGAVVTDATGIGTHNPQVQFNSMMQLQRPGLLLDAGVLYIAFGSRGDIDPYHGWIFAYRASDLTRLDVVCTTPNGSAGGIWQAGQGLIADGDGNVYMGSGNGDSEQVPGVPGTPNVAESFIKLKLIDNQLQILGWYNAFDDQVYVPPRFPNDNAVENDDPTGQQLVRDDDLGAAAPTLLTDGRIVGGGKDGYFYLIDPDQLSGDAAQSQRGAQANTVVLQYFLASFNFNAGTRPVPTFLGNQLRLLDATHHIHGAPLAFDSNGTVLVYVWGENDVVRAYRYASEIDGHPFSGGFFDMGNISGLPIDTSDSKQSAVGVVSPVDGNEFARGSVVASNEDVRRSGMPGGFLSLSWDGQNPSSAILWASFPPFRNGNSQPVEGELVAYDASQFDPQRSFLRITALWRSRQNQDDDYGIFSKFCCPTVADGKVFQPTGDGWLFAYGLKNLDGSKSAGGYNLARNPQTPSFGGINGLTLNGSASIGGPAQNPQGHVVQSIVLTQNPQSNLSNTDRAGVPLALVPTFYAGSVFCTEPVDVTNLRTSFTILLTSLDADNMADGFTFTLQAQGPRALGSPGAGLGYASDPSDQTNTNAQIPRSLALAFNIVNNTLSLWRDGTVGQPSTAFITDFGTHGIALNSGRPLFVTVAYANAAKVLTVTVSNPGTNASFGPFPIPNIDIPAFLKLGNPALAFIGFTGGTGAKSARQEVLDWSVP